MRIHASRLLIVVYKPWLNRIVILTSGAIFCWGNMLKLHRCMNIANMIFASSKAKFCPIQLRGPAAKGRYVNGWNNSGLRLVLGARIQRV